MIRPAIFALTLLGAYALPLPAMADSAPVYTSWRNNLGAGGYDIVSFYSGKPQAGKAEFSADYNGASWQFSTRANRDLFNANPDAFLPQYGGYCAWAVAKGKLAKGSPEHWHIEDGKLYLNFNARIKRRWDKVRAAYIKTADESWPDILTD
jgi:YHS domain-containing protein